MEIQQHDGVVVEVAAISVGLRQAQREGEVLRREREVPGARGGTGPWEIQSPRGAAAKGGGVPPKASGAPPTPRVSNPRRRGGPRGAHQPTRGWFPSPLQPMGPSGIGGSIRWTPGTLPVVPVQYR